MSKETKEKDVVPDHVYFIMSEPDNRVVSFMSWLGYTHTDDVYKADIAVFPGGADVTPFLYGEKALAGTKSSINRDRREIKFYLQLPVAMPKIGICRGAQFLNVLAGGTLWQHVSLHATAKGHMVKDMYSPDCMFHVTSTHHQMMRPAEHAMVLAAASEATHKHADGEHLTYKAKNDWDDPEVVYYDNNNSLCYQPHPEYPGDMNRANQKYFAEIVETYLLTEKQARCVRETHKKRANFNHYKQGE